MTEIGPIFARLGLEQYLDSFIVEGFDTWETVLDIQEGDLDALNVKLGHRRKLQREIANQRGALDGRSIGSPTTEASGEAGKISDSSPTPTAQSERNGTETKRKYRRHPKPDKNSPERPPSAYVIFSNQIREEVRAQNLSFTDIAKLVGDRWQKLTLEDKEPFESQANAAKEKFSIEFALYKKTDSYKQYTHYIAEFKAKHGGSTADGKRPRLVQNSNSGIGSSRSNEMAVEARPRVSMAHARDISIGSINCTSYHGSLSSPKGGTTVLSPTMMRSRMGTHISQISSTRTANSPPLRPEPRERRIPPVLLLHGSAPLDAHQMRGDLPELHSRTGQLSLAPLSNGMNSPTADVASCDRFSTAFPPPPLQHQSSVSSVAHSDSSGTSIAPPVTPADEPWRCQSLEAKAKTADWPRMYNPLFGNIHGAPFGPLPPLQPADRVPDVTRDPRQRTLPFPGSSSPHDLQASFRVHLRNATPLAPSESYPESPGENREETNSPLDSSESDAVNALAVLAYTGR